MSAAGCLIYACTGKSAYYVLSLSRLNLNDICVGERLNSSD